MNIEGNGVDDVAVTVLARLLGKGPGCSTTVTPLEVDWAYDGGGVFDGVSSTAIALYVTGRGGTGTRTKTLQVFLPDSRSGNGNIRRRFWSLSQL